MALRPFLNTIAMATSTGEQFGSPHCTSRAFIKTVSGTARIAALTCARIDPSRRWRARHRDLCTGLDGVREQVLGPRYYSRGGVLPLSNFRGVEHACQGDRRRRPTGDGFERCGALSLISLISAFLRQSGPYCSHLPRCTQQLARQFERLHVRRPRNAPTLAVLPSLPLALQS